jgi:hypothetical protein
MSVTDRHASSAAAARRLGVTAAVAAALTIFTGIAAVAAAQPATPGSATPGATAPRPAALRVPGAASADSSGAGAKPAHAGHESHAGHKGHASHASHASREGKQAPVLTAFDRQDCPAAAAACVDLARHITWLQADGTVSFGPVAMEPGEPGTAYATPRGTFHVSWKAGPHYRSTVYHEQMPWATFFAPGGIAFHGGSLTRWSHGCVHLTVANARYYQENLPTGAEVVVF